ncbi:MAG: hypothetical protein IJ614_08965 [Prevotella sp.]|nr:hypothetical protein [Prevotella sp.]
MKLARYNIIIGVALLLFASCGQQQQAKSVVKEFMEKQLVDASELSYIDFANLDSTRVVSDSLLQDMRNRKSEHYTMPSHYADSPSGKLFMMRVSYRLGTDTCSATFYFDDGISGVVAFKEN